MGENEHDTPSPPRPLAPFARMRRPDGGCADDAKTLDERIDDENESV